MIYLGARALLTFINPEKETEALRAWRQAVLARAMAYRVPRLGSLDAIHLASADPFREELTGLVTYDQELAKAAGDLGFPVRAPA